MMKTEHLSNFHIAGFTYYDGALIFRKLKIGKKVTLVLEEGNKYDARAVAIYYKKHKIGFVPRIENKIIYKMLKIGLEKNLSVVIQQINSRENPERQIRILIHLKNE